MPHATADETLYLDVAVIGAGWYGLKAASTYLKLAPDTKLAIFDKYDSVGGTWNRERIYPNLVAQVEFGYFNYPSTPMPRDGKTDNGLVAGDMICRYLERYAEESGLKPYLRHNSWVSSVERHPSGHGWVLSVNGRRVEAEKLVCATGVTTQTNSPDFQVLDGSVPVKHVVDLAKAVPSFSDPSKKREHFVLVGAAKSAYDAAYLLCSLGKKVTWIIRENGSGPMPIMPAKMLGRNTITMSTSRLMSNLSPSLMTTDSPAGAFFHRTWLGRFLTRSAWGYISNLADKAAGFGGGAASKTTPLRPTIKDNSAFWCDSSLGLITMEDFWTTLEKGNLTVLRDTVGTADAEGVSLLSGKRVNADYVIYATGWGDHFSFFSPELKEELGLPQYGHETAPADAATPPHKPRSDPWRAHDDAADALVAGKIPLLGAGPADFDGWKVPAARRKVMKVRRWRLYNRMVQGLWAAAYLLGDLALPGRADMVREVAEWNAWTRKRYASVGERYPYALFDWVPYLDRLMKDLGLETRRHKGVLADFFSPYGPHCYANVLDEYNNLRKRDSKSEAPTVSSLSS
ncbi:flavin-binding monooxygenase-like family protein [Chaetomium fimeti]|uniref:Flavin-binding monooxygenase-like family protein n=1 Tax=Chaetomium fimeti TaxID=1854472 RepID=A0AAE0LW67_9PEZI|nr:flavin-binding monooxygenase-like family protein [Chaetomium fimeti]